MTDTPEDILLRGVVRTENVEHPAQYIPAVLKRCATRHLERTYEIKGWEEKPTSTAEEEENRPTKTDKVRTEESLRFLEMIARKSGRLIKGGEADIDGIAKQVINDFLRGKIPWYVPPPKTEGAEAEEEEKAKGRDAKLGLTGKKRKAEEEAEAEDETVAGEGDDSSADEEFAGFDDTEGGVSLVADEDEVKA